MTTQPHTPPMEASNEAEPDRLEIARAEGASYAKALHELSDMPYLWHLYLYHYGSNARVPGEGPYDVRVRIDPPAFMRHDPVNGKRYERPVELVFADRRFKPGRKPSPDASPRGDNAPYAG